MKKALFAVACIAVCCLGLVQTNSNNGQQDSGLMWVVVSPPNVDNGMAMAARMVKQNTIGFTDTPPVPLEVAFSTELTGSFQNTMAASPSTMGAMMTTAESMTVEISQAQAMAAGYAILPTNTVASTNFAESANVTGQWAEGLLDQETTASANILTSSSNVAKIVEVPATAAPPNV